MSGLLALLLWTEAWDARSLFERGVSEGLRLAGEAVELARGELVEDDGPAAGYSYQAQEEIAEEGVWLRKELLIPDPRARRAVLLLGSNSPWTVRINGTPAALEPVPGAGKHWKGYAFDPALLRPGRNEIVLCGPGKIWIARDDEFAAGCRTRARHPNRSAKSRDGGRTWDDARLGKKGDVDGEYYVRLFLDRHLSAGRLRLPVMDLGALEGRPWGGALRSPGTLRIEPQAEGVAVRLRSGPAPVPDPAWSSWKELAGPEQPAGRYVQLEVVLTTADPLTSPRLRGLRIEASPERLEDWTAKIGVAELRNPEIVRTSIPFAYEPFDHPKLKALRERFGLEEVVAGAQDELELVVRLARWTSGRWSKGHLAEAYPAWDALEILAPHRDGTPTGGFCQQYNLVLLQACESLGLPGRAVSIGPGIHEDRLPGGGHEVVEIWSNQFGKWIYVDGQAGWHAADAATGTPLSLLELRERQLRALRGEAHPPVRIVTFAETRHAWKGLTSWPPFVELRLVPRSDFLQNPAPLPLNQGMRGWSWTGHQVWDDDEAPASLIYGGRIRRRGNFEWTLNGVHAVLEAAPERGVFVVHLDTETPGFAGFAAAIDGAAPRPVASGFRWTLRPGLNRLELRSRNIAGRLGPPCVLQLEHP